MSRKIKPLRSLYFQFGQLLVPKLDAAEIFTLLKQAGLVEAVVLQDGEITHYRETKQLTDTPENSFRTTVLKALRGSK